MDDLISRKAAIDAIMGQPPEPHYPSWYAAQIKKLPAAQPDHNADIGKKAEGDCISRRAVLYAIVNNPSEEIRQQWIGHNSQGAYLTGSAHRQLEIIDLIDKLPTARPERKQGRWIKEENRGQLHRCSACGNFLDFRGVNAGRGNANFCPNCGADMRPKEGDA